MDMLRLEVYLFSALDDWREVVDDLEAVKQIVDILQALDPNERERVIRWSLEKMGIEAPSPPKSVRGDASLGDNLKDQGSNVPLDIKSFVTAKNPGSDNQFAATVAYYYAFEAPEDQRKSEISEKGAVPH